MKRQFSGSKSCLKSSFPHLRFWITSGIAFLVFSHSSPFNLLIPGQISKTFSPVLLLDLFDLFHVISSSFPRFCLLLYCLEKVGETVWTRKIKVHQFDIVIKDGKSSFFSRNNFLLSRKIIRSSKMGMMSVMKNVFSYCFVDAKVANFCSNFKMKTKFFRIREDFYNFEKFGLS